MKHAVKHKNSTIRTELQLQRTVKQAAGKARWNRIDLSDFLNLLVSVMTCRLAGRNILW